MKKEGKKIPHKLVTDKRKKIKKGNVAQQNTKLRNSKRLVYGSYSIVLIAVMLVSNNPMLKSLIDDLKSRILRKNGKEDDEA